MNFKNKYKNIFIIIIFTVMIYLFLQTKNDNKNKNLIVESMTNKEIDEISDGSSHFCRMHQEDPVKLETQCATLSKSNCKTSKCCALINNYKCMAGSADGPIFKYDKYGKSVPIDTYFYMNKCYGNDCVK